MKVITFRFEKLIISIFFIIVIKYCIFESNQTKENIFYINDIFIDPANYNLYKHSNPFLNQTEFKITNYFDFLKFPTANCKKLAKFGGSYDCKHKIGDGNFIDGNKVSIVFLWIL